MTLRCSLFSAAAFWLASTQAAGWINPSYTTPYGPGAYQNTRVWRVGEVHEIQFDPADIQDYDGGYTIALWQKGVQGGDALGPVLDKSDTIPLDNIAFNWTVELADFHLEWSNVYYLWLWEGDNQGNIDFHQVSSAYFNITDGTDEFAPSSSSTSSPATSTTSFTSVSSAPPPSVAPSTTSEPSTTAADGGATSSSSSSSSSSSGGSGSSDDNDSAPLSTGAGIGIGLGVGAGVLGVSGVVCTWLLVRHRRKKQQQEGSSILDNNNCSASMMMPMQGYDGSGGTPDQGGYSDSGPGACYIPTWPNNGNKPMVHSTVGVGMGEPIMLDSTPTSRAREPAELDGDGSLRGTTGTTT